MAAANSNKKVTVPMTKSKETKGTWMFLTDDDTAPITNLYVSKAGLDKIGKSEKIKVTVEGVG